MSMGALEGEELETSTGALEGEALMANGDADGGANEPEQGSMPS
jgi:hypothetical protein